MPQLLPSPDQPEKIPPRDSEVDLTALFRAIWNTRNLVLAVAGLTALAFVAALALTKVSIPTTHTFQTAVRFVFPGAEKGLYPNGSAFAISDLLSPVVVEQVHRQNQLDKFGIDQRKFIAALNVEPYAPGLSEISARYEARLTDKKLSFSDRKQIEGEMEAEMTAIAGKAARLRLDLTGVVPLSPELGEKLLLDVVRTWVDYSIEHRGVLEQPRAISVRDRIDPATMRDYEPILVLEILHDHTDRQISQLEELAKYVGPNAVGDGESGHTVQSLTNALQSFRKYRLLDVGTVLRGQSGREAALNALSLRMDEATQSENEFNRRAAAIENSLKIYSDRSSAGEVATVQPSGELPGTSSAAPQLGEGFIDRLIDLLKRNDNDRTYRQHLVSQFLEVKQQAIEVTRKKERAMTLSERIRSLSTSALTENLPGAEIERNLAKIIDEFNDMTAIGTRLFTAFGRSQISTDGRLVALLELPANEKTSTYHPLLNPNIAMTGLLTSFAAGILAMFAGLVWQMRDAPRK